MDVVLEAAGGVRLGEHTIRIGVNDETFNKPCVNCHGRCCTATTRNTEALDLQGLKLMRVLTSGISGDQFAAFERAYDMYHQQGGNALDIAIARAERGGNDAYRD